MLSDTLATPERPAPSVPLLAREGISAEDATFYEQEAEPLSLPCPLPPRPCWSSLISAGSPMTT